MKRKPLPQERGLGNNPFASLKAKLPDRGSLPEVLAPAPAVAVAVPSKGPARAVIRMERKGHGGKEVTVVEHLALPASEMEKWLKALKQSLGCGGTLSDDRASLVLQGDQRERLEPLLQKRGVRRVTAG